MPTVGGPKSTKRRLLCSVVKSAMLYVAPIWKRAMERANLRQKLQSIQRKMALRESSAYITISGDVVLVIAGIAPIKFLVEERNTLYKERMKVKTKRN